jgi:hypothetical protein
LLTGKQNRSKCLLFGCIKEVFEMGYQVFFKELIYLEDTFMGNEVERKDDGTIKNYSTDAVSTFFALRNYVLSCAWTTSNSIKFIVNNMRLNSAELAQKYEAETGKQKADVTFRVQRRDASKALYSIFGTGFSEVLISDNRSEVLKLKDYITLLTEGSKDIYSLFSGYVLHRLSNLPEIKNIYSVDECSKELQVLSKFTTEYFEIQIDDLNLDKVKYVYNILTSSLLLGTDNKSFNRNKAIMLSAIKKYARVQNSNKVRDQDGVEEKMSKLSARVDELEEENQQKDALISNMKASFRAAVNKEVERILHEERMKQQEEEDLKLFDNVNEGFGKQQL